MIRLARFSMILSAAIMIGLISGAINWARADAPAVQHDIKILWWIRIDGCPRGHYDIFVAASVDGKEKIKHFDETDSPGDDVLAKALGDAPGFHRTYNCGFST